MVITNYSVTMHKGKVLDLRFRVKIMSKLANIKFLIGLLILMQSIATSNLKGRVTT